MATVVGGGHDLYLSQKSLPLKKEKKLSQLLAKDEDGCKESSFRAYYEGSGVAVPFIWESIPGTPKHSLFSDSYYSNMPPLTPPPPYHSKHVVVMMTDNNKSSLPSILQNQTSSSKNRLLRSIFGRHRNVSRLSWTTSSSSISSLSSSSYDDSSSHSTPTSFTASKSKKKKKINSILHRRWSSLSSNNYNRPRSPLQFAEEDDEENAVATPGSPSSTLCFAVGGKNGNTTTSQSQQGFRGCFQWRI